MKRTFILFTITAFILVTTYVVINQYAIHQQSVRGGLASEIGEEAMQKSGIQASPITAQMLEKLYKNFDNVVSEVVANESVSRESTNVTIGQFILKGIVHGEQKFILLSPITGNGKVIKVAEGESIEGWEIRSINRHAIEIATKGEIDVIDLFPFASNNREVKR